MKSKIVKILIAVAVVVILVVAAVFVLLRQRPANNADGTPTVSRKEMENIATIATASFGFPKMMDDEARAEGVQVTDDNLFQIFITLVNIDSAKPTFEADTEKIKATLPGSACEKHSVRFLLIKGITVKLSFKSNDAKELFDYVIKPGTCPE